MHSRDAQTDILRQFRYLVDLGVPHMASRFKEAVKSTAKEISNHPNAATPCQIQNPELLNLRSWPVGGFEALRIYFLLKHGKMIVIRVLHGKRDNRVILAREKLTWN